MTGPVRFRLSVPENRVAALRALAAYWREIMRPPRSVADRTYPDLPRWTRFQRGGHFPALGCPKILAEDIWAAFRPLRRPGD